jgi:hypothetical protein
MAMEIVDERGRPLDQDKQRLIATTMAALRSMTEHERGMIFCWFCPVCHKYIGPGENFCHTISYEAAEEGEQPEEGETK